MKQNSTIGMDLGDKKHVICELDAQGTLVKKEHVVNTEHSIRKYFSQYREATIIIETGTHSPWISRLLEEMGHKVVVSNSRKVKAIWSSERKSDGRDAEMLGRIGRVDPALLSPIHHRGRAAQEDLMVLKARDQLVRSRTQLINHVRGSIKTAGGRIRKSSAANFHKQALVEMPIALQKVFKSIVTIIADITNRIKAYDKYIERISKEKYPETQTLQQVTGIGPVTSLAYVLTLEEVGRFRKKRSVGAFLGLTPRKDQSGESDKQLRITKAGNGYLRRLLVGCAQYILGPFGSDSDLRRFGNRLASRGGKNAKRRAVVAVARKLSILLYVLWDTGSVYAPLYNQKHDSTAA